MKVVTLLENTAISDDFTALHGLSFYIETENHKILFDVGPGDEFAENANLAGIDLKQVDTVVISHGHWDHGGGIKKFLTINDDAVVYINNYAFEPHYSKALFMNFYVGLETKLKSNERIKFVNESFVIDDEIRLLSGVKERVLFPSMNALLTVKTEWGLEADNFKHEQSMIVTENGKNTLFGGCAHCGIVNIQKKAEEIIGSSLNTVVSGFHMQGGSMKKTESNETIDEIANILNKNNTIYYTCHCTGLKPYERLKSVMGDKIRYLATGSSIEI